MKMFFTKMVEYLGFYKKFFSVFVYILAVPLSHITAQTGPGGIGTADGSGSTPINVIWLEADALGLTDGNDITSWSDLSGNGNDFSVSSTYSPIYRDASPLNGHGFAEFSKSNNRIVLNPFGEMPSEHITTVIVYKTTDSGDGMLSYNTSSQDNAYLLFNNSNLRTYINGTSNTSGVVYNSGNWQILGHRWQSSDGKLTYFLNGNEEANVTFRTGITVSSGGSLALGGEQDAVDGGYDAGQAFSGDIAEVIMYDAYLNDAQRKIIENYLSAKYDITISGDLYAGDGIRDYDYGVIGIGVEANGNQLTNSGGGLILSAYNGSMDTEGEYILAGHDNKTNKVATDSLGIGVQQRWFRSWYIDKTGNVDGTITFDFSDGIGGGYPANDTDYELLMLDLGGTNNYEIVTVAAKRVTGDRISFDVADANLTDGFYTLGTTDAANAPVDGVSNNNWYSYTSGNWSDPQTWTTDPSGNTRTPSGGGVPASIDNVEILSGDAVTMDADDISAGDLTVNGELTIGTTSGHAFLSISGNGKISMAGATDGTDNFPDGNASDFADPLTGGELTIKGTGIELDQDREFNDVTLDMDASGNTAVLASDWTINGGLNLNQGILQINDATDNRNLTITVKGNVTVQSGAGITVGTGDSRHQFNFYGDFTNKGTVAFTNNSSADYNNEATNGIVDANFLSDDKDQTIDCLGSTTFYRIEIDKGNDQTYILDIKASGLSNFNLYGYAHQSHSGTAQLTANNNALGLIKGTVRINENVTIPVLNNTGNYNISESARLWVNGGSVTKPSGVAIVPYGTIQVSAGTLSAPVSSGITTRDNGNIVVEGGTVTTNQIRTSIMGADNIGGYTQSGGTVNVTGVTINEDYYIFSLTYPDNTFTMSGGTLRISGAVKRKNNSSTTGYRHGGAIFINSKDGNYNVTGGTVIVDNTTGQNARVTSRAPFWNFIVTNSGGAAKQVELITGTSGDTSPGTYATITNPTLKLLNTFKIESGVVFDHNGNDVEIGGDFTIENGANYLYNSSKKNTTTINGSEDSQLAFYNRADGVGDEQKFWNLIIDKPSGKMVTLASNKTPGTTGVDNNLINIQGDAFKLLSGTLNQGYHSIRVYTDTLVNYDILTVYDPADNNSNGKNDQIKFRPDNFVLITADSSDFGNVRLNSKGYIITLLSDLKIHYLEYRHGRIDLQDNNLKIDELYKNLSNEASWIDAAGNTLCSKCFSVSDMFIMNGDASDGGLSMYIDVNESLTFPVGIGTDSLDADVDGGNSKYTPATVTVSNVTDDGYITIRPVNKELATLNSSGNRLQYYWKIDYSGFSNVPNFQLQLKYYDVDVQGTETSYVPGRVIDVTNREEDTGTGANVDDVNNIIDFSELQLKKGDYTAGLSNAFTGSVRILYARKNGEWFDPSTWSTTDDGNNPLSSPSQLPGSSDIIVIGTSTKNYHVAVCDGLNGDGCSGTNYAPIKVAQVSVIRKGGGESSILSFDETAGVHDLGYVTHISPDDLTDIDDASKIAVTGGTLPKGDFGEYASGENAMFVFSRRFPANVTGGRRVRDQSGNLIPYVYTSAYTIDNTITEYPNIQFEYTGGSSGTDAVTFPDVDITVNGYIRFWRSGSYVNYVKFNNSSSGGDVTVKGNLWLNQPDSKIEFLSTGGVRTLTIEGDIDFDNDDNGLITVEDGGDGSLIHKIALKGDIINLSSTSELELFRDGAKTAVDFEFFGGDNSSVGNFTVLPEFNNIIINKNSLSDTVIFNTNFNVGADAGSGSSPIQLLGGLLKLNHANINIDLTTSDDFNIPEGAGLEVSQGTVNVSGDDSGIRLDGCLIIDGGTVNMDDAAGNGNNYIEYGAGGSALLEISSGTLTVGSQIRPLTSAETGVLKYRQTGGSVIIGKNNGGEDDRGMLQIYNLGSEFTYTGGTLVFVRHQSSPTIAALYLDPDDFDLTGSTITIFNGDTPAGQTDFRINTTIPLNNLTINDTNSPVVKLDINPLEIDGLLTVNNSASFNASGLDLTLKGDWVNNGTFISTGNTTIFSSDNAQSLSGSGTFGFYNLTKEEIGVLSLSAPISISNTFALVEGTIADGGNSITTTGNVIIDGTHNSSGGSGIIFAGSTKQYLSRSGTGTSTLGTITINNSNSVEIPDGNGYIFYVSGDLRLQNGVFNIGSSLVSVASTGDIVEVNPFGLTNMVQTNSSYTDNGLKKYFPAGYNTDFVFPVGQMKYTPVVFDFSSSGNTFGTSAGSILVRPANSYHPAIDDGIDYFSTGDINNVLQYYWIIDADNINGFTSSAKLYYDQTDVKTDEPGYNESDYLPARILSDNNTNNDINKFSVTDVDETNNIINFSWNNVTDEGISGDYFTGIDKAIPDNVATYTSITDGNVDAAIYDKVVPGGGAPRGSVVIIGTGTTVTFNIDDINFYKTEIQSGSVLEVDQTDGHSLGTVTGTGTMRLISNSTSVKIPAGYYVDFFSCTGGGLEFAGTGDYNILGRVSTVRRLTLSGSGTRKLGNTDLLVCENFNVAGPEFTNSFNKDIDIKGNLNISSGKCNTGNGTFTVDGNVNVSGGTFDGGSGGNKIVNGNITVSSGIFNVGSSGQLSLRGHLTFSGGTFNGGTGNSIIVLDGSASQRLTGSFTGSAAFHNLEINNIAGVQIRTGAELDNELKLTTGHINPGTHVFKLLSNASVSPVTGRANSFVNGKLYKVMDSGDSFTFPIGKGWRWGYTAVKNTTGGTYTWDAEYFNTGAINETSVTNMNPTDPSTIKKISGNEYWKISDGGAAAGVDAIIGLSWDGNSDVSSSPSSREELQVMVWNGSISSWDNFGGQNFVSGHTQSAGYFESVSTIGFSENIITLGSTTEDNPLPIDLVSFKAMAIDAGVKLEWETASEQNNDFFEIQKSADGIHFKAIAEVDGSGTTHEYHYYSFLDNKPYLGYNYYRLKQVDYDGQFSFSDIVFVDISHLGSDDFGFVLYPNPTTNRVIFMRLKTNDLHSPVTVRIVNTVGIDIFSTNVDLEDLAGDLRIEMKSGVHAGMYIIRIEQGKRVAEGKLIILNK